MEHPVYLCEDMILIQETNIKLNFFEVSILSTDNLIIAKVVLNMVISIN